MVSIGTRGRAILAACLIVGLAQGAKKEPSPEHFGALHRLIRPQPGEARWASIPWMTDLAEARQRSAKEDKPLFVWRAGGGEVLGRA